MRSDHAMQRKREQLKPPSNRTCAYENQYASNEHGFPSDDKPASSSHSASSEQLASALHAESFYGKSILVAEDNLVNQQVAVRMLEKLRCRVDVALNGVEAVSKYRTAAYDLILMDCQMPDLDGLSATAQIRAMETPDRRTPIIALTAYASPSEKEKCLQAGMDDSLSKPIRLAMLQNVLGRWLKASGVVHTTSEQTSSDELEEVKAVFGLDFVELAELYLVHGSQRLTTLREAGTAGDISTVGRIAHAFGGSCASIGASHLCTLCKELEVLAKTGAVPDCDARLAAIQTEYNRISTKLQQLMQGD